MDYSTNVSDISLTLRYDYDTTILRRKLCGKYLKMITTTMKNQLSVLKSFR